MSEWNSAAATAALDRLAGTAREVLSQNVFGDTRDVRRRLEAFESDLRRSLRLAAQEMTRLEGVVATQRDRARGTVSYGEAKRLQERAASAAQDAHHSRQLYAELDEVLDLTKAELGEAQEVIANLTEERDQLSDEVYSLKSYLHGSVFRVVVDQLDRLRKRVLWHLEEVMA